MANRILIVAPHPDDEILGCGGSIRKFVNEGNDVFVLVVTNAHIGDPERFTSDGIENVRREALQAHTLLGVKETFFMDFPAPRLDTFPSYKISSSIASLVFDYKFDIVFIPHRGDIHKDHRAVFDAVLVACRPVNNCSVKKIYAYETLSETEWGAPYASDAFIPNVFITLSEEEFELKCEALAFFISQMKSFPASRSIESIEALAMYRGATVTSPKAEAFMLIREII